MSDVHPLYRPILDAISPLVGADPERDSPEGELLRGLVDACERYERRVLPSLLGTAEAPPNVHEGIGAVAPVMLTPMVDAIRARGDPAPEGTVWEELLELARKHETVLCLIACYDFNAPYCEGWKASSRELQEMACSALGVVKGSDLPGYQEAQEILEFNYGKRDE